MVKRITESTTFSLSVVLALLAGAVYVANVSFKTDANAKSLDEVKGEQKSYADELHKVHADLEGIHGELKRIRR